MGEATTNLLGDRRNRSMQCCTRGSDFACGPTQPRPHAAIEDAMTAYHDRAKPGYRSRPCRLYATPTVAHASRHEATHGHCPSRHGPCYAPDYMGDYRSESASDHRLYLLAPRSDPRSPRRQISPQVVHGRSHSAARGKSPRGRSTSTTRKARCPARICHSGLILAPTVWATPMMTPPASVPQKLPNPPMITASNA